MDIFKCVKRPTVGEVSPPIDHDNIHEIAEWCNGAICVPLFVEIDGPEIEVQDCITMHSAFARIGDRIVKFADWNFHRVSKDEFERDYAIIPNKEVQLDQFGLPAMEW